MERLWRKDLGEGSGGKTLVKAQRLWWKGSGGKALEYGGLRIAQHRRPWRRRGPEAKRPSDQTGRARVRLSAFGRPLVRSLSRARLPRPPQAACGGLRVSPAADARPAPAPRSINCPAGFILQTPVANAAQCGRDGVDCPAGQICFCRPCVPDLQVAVCVSKQHAPAVAAAKAVGSPPGALFRVCDGSAVVQSLRQGKPQCTAKLPSTSVVAGSPSGSVPGSVLPPAG